MDLDCFNTRIPTLWPFYTRSRANLHCPCGHPIPSLCAFAGHNADAAAAGITIPDAACGDDDDFAGDDDDDDGVDEVLATLFPALFPAADAPDTHVPEAVSGIDWLARAKAAAADIGDKLLDLSPQLSALLAQSNAQHQAHNDQLKAEAALHTAQEAEQLSQIAAQIAAAADSTAEQIYDIACVYDQHAAENGDLEEQLDEVKIMRELWLDADQEMSKGGALIASAMRSALGLELITAETRSDLRYCFLLLRGFVKEVKLPQSAWWDESLYNPDHNAAKLLLAKARAATHCARE